jgi:hypothetical protein
MRDDDDGHIVVLGDRGQAEQEPADVHVAVDVDAVGEGGDGVDDEQAAVFPALEALQRISTSSASENILMSLWGRNSQSGRSMPATRLMSAPKAASRAGRMSSASWSPAR